LGVRNDARALDEDEGAPQLAAPPRSAVAAGVAGAPVWVRMTQKVTIEREELNGANEFVLRVDGERLGFLDYTRPEVGVMRIEYVEVSPELRGTGLGKQLVEKAVAFAKDNSLKVIPICSYARAVIQRDPALSAATR
jgi:predicted GNAT family acetyltransferase